MADGALIYTVAARPQTFVVRIWRERQEDGQNAVRIEARHILTGETRYFLAWPALTTYLAAKLDVASIASGE